MRYFLACQRMELVDYQNMLGREQQGWARCLMQGNALDVSVKLQAGERLEAWKCGAVVLAGAPAACVGDGRARERDPADGRRPPYL